jgi:hypothetical protein
VDIGILGLSFLLSMNEVIIIIGLFIGEKGEKPIFKKFPSLCRLARFHGCLNEKLSARFLKDALKLGTSPIGSLKGLV